MRSLFIGDMGLSKALKKEKKNLGKKWCGVSSAPCVSAVGVCAYCPGYIGGSVVPADVAVWILDTWLLR